MKRIILVLLLAGTLGAQEPIHVTPERHRWEQNAAPNGGTRAELQNELQQCQSELSQAKDGWVQSYQAWAELAQVKANQSEATFVPMQLGNGQVIRTEDEMVKAYNQLVVAYYLLASSQSGLSVPATSAPTASYQPTTIPGYHYETPSNSAFLPQAIQPVVPTTPGVMPQWTWNADENRPGVLIPATPGLPRMPSVNVGYGCWTSSVDVDTGQPVSMWTPDCSGN